MNNQNELLYPSSISKPSNLTEHSESLSLSNFVYNHMNDVIKALAELKTDDSELKDISIRGRVCNLKEVEKVLHDIQKNTIYKSNITAKFDVAGRRPSFNPPEVVFLPRLRLEISPQSEAQNDIGTAYYDKENDRYIVKAVCKFHHEFNHEISVDGQVKCIILNGSSEVQAFDFSIGQFDVGVGEDKIIEIFAFVDKGSQAFQLLDEYTPLNFDFIFSSSDRPVRGSNTWMAMGKIDLSLNFIGNYSYDEQVQIQSIMNNEVSSIFNQQGLLIGDTMRNSLLPTDMNYSNFKDISFNDNGLSTEANQLRSNWPGLSNYLDIFFVESFSSVQNPAIAIGKDSGFSPIDGPTAKNSGDSGVIIEGKNAQFELLSSDSVRLVFGVYIAHFVGHFLGLQECPGDMGCSDSPLNFMKPPPTTYTPFGYILNRQFTRLQFLKVAEHGFIKKVLISDI